MKTHLFLGLFFISLTGSSQQYLKDTLHCNCIYELYFTSKDQLGSKVFVGKVKYDVNGQEVDYGPGFSGMEGFYSGVSTILPLYKKQIILAKPNQPPGKSDKVWQGIQFGETSIPLFGK